MYGVFDVRSYGALGDAATECSDRIQNAIDDAEAAGGGVVWFPEGSYRIATQLVIDSPGVRLDSPSPGAVTIRNLVPADYAITVTAADVIVRNLLIDCESVGDGGVEAGAGSTRLVTDMVRVTNSVTSSRNRSGNIPLVGGGVRYADIQLDNDAIKALAAENATLVPAPGAGLAIIPILMHLYLDVTTAGYTESADNLVVQYADGGTLITIETTGFVDQATDQARFISPAEALATPIANKALMLDNSGDGEFGGGNAANTLSIRTFYVIVPMAAFLEN